MSIHTRLGLIAIAVCAVGLMGAKPAAKPSPKPSAKAAAKPAASRPSRPLPTAQIKSLDADKPIDIKPVQAKRTPAPQPAPFEIKRTAAGVVSLAYRSTQPGMVWDPKQSFVIQLLGVNAPQIKLSPDIITPDEWPAGGPAPSVKIMGKNAQPTLQIAAKASFTECESATKKCHKRLRSWIQSVQP